MISKIINLIKVYQYHLFLAVCIGLISFISFNLGKIVSNEKGELKITQDLSAQSGANIYNATEQQTTNDQQQDEVKPTPKPLDLRVVVSKNSDKYHYSWCGSWKRILETNQIWFENEEAAIKAGYTLAGNCSK